MSLAYLLDILSGTGMFLYGMKLLSDSLEVFAGKEVETRLQNVTGTPFKGVLLGAGVTGIIQSSTATTLMTVGLINAGIMSIYEALPVIMGANIGTTVTGQILRLNEISDNIPLLSLIKPSGTAPFFVLFGAVQKLFFKKSENKQTADIFIGLGILFLGMELMEKGVAPLSRSESFCNLFLVFQNPILAILAGAVMTAVLQSSSVCVGILQSLAVTDAVTLSCAVPIILGMNIGKVLPEFIATPGTNKNTVRTIFADLTVNVCGVVIALVLFLSTDLIFNKSFDSIIATRSMIANFHTVFNLLTTFMLLPFYKRFIRVSERIIR